MRQLFDIALSEAVKRQDGEMIKAVIKFAKMQLLELGIKRGDLLLLLKDNSFALVKMLIKAQIHLPEEERNP